MSGVLFPGQKAPKIAGFKVQTSVFGLPIPIIYGTTRVPGNLIHMPSTPVQVNQGQSKISPSKGASSGQTFYAAMIMSLGEGPIIGIGNVWRDKDAKVAFTTYSSAGWGLVLGTSSQAAWASLPSAQRLTYQSIAYVDNANWPLPNDSLSSYSWEVKGFEIFGGGVVDASPADIVPDYLTNEQYGVGFPSAQIGDLTSFQDYCAAFGLFCSPSFTDQQPARDQLNELLEIANTGAVWSDGVLKFVPYGDLPGTGHGHTYTPNTTPIYDLVDNDFIAGDGEDPITVLRKSPLECFNQVPVEYEDRAFDYNGSQIKAEDQVSLLAFGPRPMPTMALHSIKTATVAQQVAWMRLQREQNIRNTYQFKTGWRFILLEPMDLITLTDVGLGLDLTPVRITSVEELDNEEGLLFTAEDWPFGTASATAYQTASNTGTSSNANVSPGNTTAPIIFEGPQPLQSSPLEIWIGASGGTNWGGCDVYISVDNVNFTKIGTIYGRAAFGDLSANLSTGTAYPGVDTSNTLSVDLTSSGQTLVAQSQSQFDNLVPLCYIGGREFVAFRDLSLTSAFNYDLTHLYRGLYGSTIPGVHNAGAAFVFCDDRLIHLPWPTGYIGQVLHFKFPAFNIYGAALQDVSSVSSVAHTVGTDPIIPGEVPTLDLHVTPGSSTYTITYTYFGTLQVNIDGAGWISDPGSPITVTLDNDGHNYAFRVSAGDQTIPDSVAIPALNEIPTLDLQVTPGPTSYQIDYTYVGSFQYWIDGVGPYSDPGSPITVMLDTDTHTYDFLISGGSGTQSIPNHVSIPSLTTNPINPAITSITLTSNASTFACDGGNSFDISWTTINMPGTVQFNLVWTITSNGSGSGSPTNVTSPYSIPNCTICPGATTRITIVAIVDGLQIASAVFDDAIPP